MEQGRNLFCCKNNQIRVHIRLRIQCQIYIKKYFQSLQMATTEQTQPAQQQPKEQKPGQEERQKPKRENGGNDRNDRKREPRGPKVQYIVKGEEGQEQLKQDIGGEGATQGQEKPQKPKRPPRERVRPEFDWDKSKITLETKVPELPKKPIEKPNKEEFFSKLDRIEADIDKARDQFKRFKEDLKKAQEEQRQGNKEKKENEVIPLGKMVGEKIKLVKQKREEFQKLKDQYDQMKERSNDLYNQGQQIRQKLKSLDNYDAIKSELAKLKNSLQYDKLSANDEKKIMNQIHQYERCLPYAEPLEKLEKEQQIVNEKMREHRKLMNAAYEDVKKLDDEIKEAKGNYDNLKDLTKDENYKNKTNPILDAKRQEIDAKINDLKDRKDRLRKEYDENYDKYEDYEDLKRYHDWVVRQKEKLNREEEKKKKEAQRKARDEARAKREADKLAREQAEADAAQKEEEEQKDSPFQTEIEICELLIKYCEKLRPQQNQRGPEQRPQVDIQKALQSDEWKKEKVTVLGADEPEEDLYKFSSMPGRKNRKQGRGQQQQPRQEEKKPDSITHDIQTIQFFGDVRVALPRNVEDLENTLKSLRERRELYLKANDDPEQLPEERQQKQKKQPKQKQTQQQEEETAA